ncbi:HD domain-containing protein [Vibrio sp. 99-8-1]|nr:HD domain-containing protein [Vibrio sp. 99-8-1]
MNNRLRVRCCKTVYGFLTLWLLLSPAVLFAKSMQNILVLHSYDASYGWTVDSQHGIEDAIKTASQPIKLSVEYLDTKRISNPEYYKYMREYIKYKYNSYEFDGVILTDDNALTFFNSLKLDNLKGLPTVAVGINNIEASLYSSTSKGTVIYENDYIVENIRLIKRLRPNLKTLYFLSDYSVTSKITREKILTELAKHTDIALAEIRSESLAQAGNTLSKISPDDAVLLTHFNTELDTGTYYGYEEVARRLSAKSAAPIFVFWEFYIQGDVLGGYVNRSYKMGVQAVELLGAKLPESINVTMSVEKEHAAVFNFSSIDRYQIPMSLLPEEAYVIGKPKSYVEKNIRILSFLLVVLVLLMIVILILSISLKRKRKINRQKQQLIEIQEQNLAEQKNFIHLLSDAIEAHSGGIGHHINSVAEMTGLLARFAGLTKHEQRVIEKLSPMHDIGKIGVPREILMKARALTDNERLIVETHTVIGHQLLSNSEGELMGLAAMIALDHHEYWNGKGYPNNKVGSSIHIFARITAIVDVFDALLSPRCYREPWSITDVMDYFEEQSGEQFDPQLTRLLLDNIDEFLLLRDL